jgi:hypothetical protein
MNRLLILLLLIPMVSFGEERYACERTQINIKKNEIIAIANLGDNHDSVTNYIITSNDERRINAYNDDTGGVIQVITFTKKPLKATFAVISFMPTAPDGGHVYSFTSNCIKIK